MSEIDKLAPENVSIGVDSTSQDIVTGDGMTVDTNDADDVDIAVDVSVLADEHDTELDYSGDGVTAEAASGEVTRAQIDSESDRLIVQADTDEEGSLELSELRLENLETTEAEPESDITYSIEAEGERDREGDYEWGDDPVNSDIGTVDTEPFDLVAEDGDETGDITGTVELEADTADALEDDEEITVEVERNDSSTDPLEIDLGSDASDTSEKYTFEDVPYGDHEITATVTETDLGQTDDYEIMPDAETATLEDENQDGPDFEISQKTGEISGDVELDSETADALGDEEQVTVEVEAENRSTDTDSVSLESGSPVAYAFEDVPYGEYDITAEVTETDLGETEDYEISPSGETITLDSEYKGGPDFVVQYESDSNGDDGSNGGDNGVDGSNGGDDNGDDGSNGGTGGGSGGTGGGGGTGGSGDSSEPDHPEPTAVISIDPDPAAVDEDVTFSATDSFDDERSITAFEWTIDDARFKGETVLESFDDPGKYEVELTVTNDLGESNTTSTTLEATERSEPPTSETNESDGGETEPAGAVDPEPATPVEIGNEPVPLTAVVFGHVALLSVGLAVVFRSHGFSLPRV